MPKYVRNCGVAKVGRGIPLRGRNLFRYGTTVQEDNILNCDERLERFVTVVKMAADNSIPTSSGNVGRVRVPWWTDECARVNSDRKHALRQYKRSGLLVHKISYNKWRSRARYVKNEARRSSWKNYVSGLNINTPMSKVWSRIRKMSGKYSAHQAPCLSYNNDVTSNPLLIAEMFADHFENVSSNNSYSANFLRVKQNKELVMLDFSSNEEEIYNGRITERELNGALR